MPLVFPKAKAVTSTNMEGMKYLLVIKSNKESNNPNNVHPSSHLSDTLNCVRDWKTQDHIVKTKNGKRTGTPSATQFPLKGAKELMCKRGKV